MNRRFAPIFPACPDPRKPPTRVLASLLEPARVQPCYEGMDDQGEYAVAMGREALEGMLVVDCPEAA